MPDYGQFTNIPDDAYNAIWAASKAWNVPFGFILSIAGYENGIFQCDRVWDDNHILSNGTFSQGHKSHGLMALHTPDGIGDYQPDLILHDCFANANTAAFVISSRYAASSEHDENERWLDAAKAWSTAGLALAHWRSFGDPETGNQPPSPNPSLIPGGNPIENAINQLTGGIAESIANLPSQLRDLATGFRIGTLQVSITVIALAFIIYGLYRLAT